MPDFPAPGNLEWLPQSTHIPSSSVPNKRLHPVDPVNDFTWTKRILVWCADLLKLCFGEGKSLPFSEKMNRWSALKAFDLKRELNKPLEFKPLYFEEAGLVRKVLPGHLAPECVSSSGIPAHRIIPHPTRSL